MNQLTQNSTTEYSGIFRLPFTCRFIAWTVLTVISLGCVDGIETSVGPAKVVGGGQENQIDQQNLAAIEFECLNGERVVPFEDDSVNVVAIVFGATDCPIANAYLPRLKELQQEFAQRGVRMFFIHPSQDITKDEARAHAVEYQITMPIVLDKDLTHTKRLEASVTPEVVLLVKGCDRPVYRGAIDNQYFDYGKKRRSASSHYLSDAIKDVLAGRTVRQPETKPIGCFIESN